MPRTDTEPMIPTDQEALLSREVLAALEKNRAAAEDLRIEMEGVGALKLPRAAAVLLLKMLAEMSKGNAVTLVPTETEITTQQAAELLNVSRPYVVGLIEKGELPMRMVGNQRRLPLAAVVAYKSGTRARALEAMREVASIDQELGLR